MANILRSPFDCNQFSAISSLSLLALLAAPTGLPTGPSDAFFFRVSPCEDTTPYSPGYNESVIRSERPGETKDEVLAQLGEPIL